MVNLKILLTSTTISDAELCHFVFIYESFTSDDEQLFIDIGSCVLPELEKTVEFDL